MANDALDPEFQALLAPSTQAPASSGSALDPEFAALAQPAAPPAPKWSWTNFLKGQGNELARAGAEAVWALPGAAADAGVAARNIIGDKFNSMMGKPATPDYPLASDLFHQVLDQYTTPPQTGWDKAGELATSMALGSRIPGPTFNNSVPSNFSGPMTQAQQNLAQVRQAGAVFPPSTVNPSILNKVIESVGGKTGTEQDASLANMKWTDSMARKAVGMAPDAEITPQALDGIIKSAGTAKGKIISASGDAVNMDPAYSQGISAILDPYRQAGAELGDSYGNPALVKAGEAIDKPQITPKVAVGAIDQLRDQSKMAFRTGDNTTGVAYKALATNLEDAIDRHLVANGNQNVVNDFRDARQLQAKAYDIKDALNSATGHVDANVLKRADYLTGPLQTVGNAAQMAPKAFKQITDSGPVRNTDIMTGGLAAVMEKQPWFLAYPLLRAAARKTMLSQPGQNALIGKPQGLLGAPRTQLPGWIPSLLAQSETQSQ